MGAVSVVLSYKASLQRIMQHMTVTVTCSQTSIPLEDMRHSIYGEYSNQNFYQHTSSRCKTQHLRRVQQPEFLSA